MIKTLAKGFAISFCGLAVLAYTSMLLFPTEDLKQTGLSAIFIVLDILFIFLLYLLLRKKKTHVDNTDAKTVSSYLPEVPPDILRDMRKSYTAMQADSDMRILSESFQLIQQTTDFDTFFSRLELAQKKALTLLQAVQAKCRGINPAKTVKGCEAVLSNVQNAKRVFLDNSYTKETESALQLKTKAGQCKRLEKYLEKLQAHEAQFSDVQDTFDATVSKLQDLISETRPADTKTSARPTPAKPVSAADEIAKFKQLLDTGAITQEEYDAKKNQLLGL